MASSYGNISVRGVERASLVAWLGAAKIDAWVGPEAGKWTAFSEARADAFDLAAACEVMIRFAGDLDCAAICAAVHNSDVLGILAVNKGRHVASYISYPGIFAEVPPEELKPEITGAAGMLAALGAPPNEAKLKQILAVGTPEQFVYPVDLHSSFVRAYGLPEYSLRLSFSAAIAGPLPGAADDFIKV